MTQHSTFDDNGAHYLSSPVVIDTVMRATRVMTVRGFVLSLYALSIAAQRHHPIRRFEASESGAPQVSPDLEEANDSDLAGSPR
jgi:hypothetical protein